MQLIDVDYGPDWHYAVFEGDNTWYEIDWRPELLIIYMGTGKFAIPEGATGGYMSRKIPIPLGTTIQDVIDNIDVYMAIMVLECS